MSTPVIDQRARDMAQAAINQIQSHEKECAIRWSGSMASMNEIRRVLTWGFGLLIVTGISLIGYLWTHPPPH